MPTVITHALAGVALGQSSDRSWAKTWRFWGLIVLCSALPDVDSLGLYFGIPYASFWGHRGFLHSLTFAVLAGIALSTLIHCPVQDRWKPALILSVVMASHGFLDAMTNGGLGVAFFSPFSLHRYFFPWRPIRVSPIGLGFFSERGRAVLKSEVLTVWAPAVFVGLILRGFRLLRRNEEVS
jgi:inner membrane protein